jgi:uncharacterized protein (TIGR02466 family)
MNENFWDYSAPEKKIELNNVHSIFSIPVFESTIMISNIDEIMNDLTIKYKSLSEDEELLSSNGSMLSSMEAKKQKNVSVRNKISYYSEDTLHEQSIYKELTSAIESVTQDIFNVYEYDSITPHVVTMWGNVLGEKGYIHAHSHSNSMFSGVWYPEDPPETEEGSLSNCIKLIDPTRIKFFFMPQIKKKNPLNSGEVFIKPKKGMCLIFPSWLEHDTMPNENQFTQRYSISFNIFPKGILGYPNSLNRLTL